MVPDVQLCLPSGILHYLQVYIIHGERIFWSLNMMRYLPIFRYGIKYSEGGYVGIPDVFCCLPLEAQDTIALLFGHYLAPC